MQSKSSSRDCHDQSDLDSDVDVMSDGEEEANVTGDNQFLTASEGEEQEQQQVEEEDETKKNGEVATKRDAVQNNDEDGSSEVEQ